MNWVIIRVLGLLMGTLVVLLVLFIRNEIVYTFRMRILREDGDTCLKAIHSGRFRWELPFHRRYERLPSYNRMCLAFWRRMSTYEKQIGSVASNYPELEA